MVHKYTAGKLQSFSYLINRYQMFRLFNWKIPNRQLHLSVWLDGIVEMIMQILIFFHFVTLASANTIFSLTLRE